MAPGTCAALSQGELGQQAGRYPGSDRQLDLWLRLSTSAPPPPRGRAQGSKAKWVVSVGSAQLGSVCPAWVLCAFVYFCLRPNSKYHRPNSLPLLPDPSTSLWGPFLSLPWWPEPEGCVRGTAPGGGGRQLASFMRRQPQFSEALGWGRGHPRRPLSEEARPNLRAARVVSETPHDGARATGRRQGNGKAAWACPVDTGHRRAVSSRGPPRKALWPAPVQLGGRRAPSAGGGVCCGHRHRGRPCGSTGKEQGTEQRPHCPAGPGRRWTEAWRGNDT